MLKDRLTADKPTLNLEELNDALDKITVENADKNQGITTFDYLSLQILFCVLFFSS